MSRAPIAVATPRDDLAEGTSFVPPRITLLCAIDGLDPMVIYPVVEKVKAAAVTDPVMKELRDSILNGFLNEKRQPFASTLLARSASSSYRQRRRDDFHGSSSRHSEGAAKRFTARSTENAPPNYGNGHDCLLLAQHGFRNRKSCRCIRGVHLWPSITPT